MTAAPGAGAWQIPGLRPFALRRARIGPRPHPYAIAGGECDGRDNPAPGAAPGRDRRGQRRLHPPRDSALNSPGVGWRRSRARSGLADDRNRARIRAPGGAAAHRLFVGGLDELARISFQPAPDHPARVRMRRFHHRRRRRRREVRSVPAMAGRLSARRDRCAARRGRAAFDRAPAEASQTDSSRARGRRTGE